MEKMTIPQKRAAVYREWILSKLGNDERYYMATLYTGIPDGESGYYVNKQVIFNEDEALSAAGYSIPDRIYIKH